MNPTNINQIFNQTQPKCADYTSNHWDQAFQTCENLVTEAVKNERINCKKTVYNSFVCVIQSYLSNFNSTIGVSEAKLITDASLKGRLRVTELVGKPYYLYNAEKLFSAGLQAFYEELKKESKIVRLMDQNQAKVNRIFKDIVCDAIECAPTPQFPLNKLQIKCDEANHHLFMRLLITAALSLTAYALTIKYFDQLFNLIIPIQTRKTPDTNKNTRPGAIHTPTGQNKK